MTRFNSLVNELALVLCRSVAENFAEMNGDSDPAKGKVIWTFKFEHMKCVHVNFIMHTAMPKEKEFLMPPYTVLILEELTPSKDLEKEPHRITVRVASDNLKDENGNPHCENLPLAPWI